MGGYQLTAIIEREDDLFVARCLELDIASHGSSGPAALSNLKEAVALFVADAKEADVLELLTREVEVTLFEVDRC
jgi:predicted RNase H-like HicB family nuclease